MKRTNVIALVKNGERYVFLYDGVSIDALLRQFGRFAADQSLSFSWYDAAVMSQRVRHQQTVAEPDDSVPRPA